MRDSKTGDFLVLEDNVRTPSGISYVLENRAVMTRTFPTAFQLQEVLPVHHYPLELVRILRMMAPQAANPVVVVLTPGLYNSAYFEHSFLAHQMGMELVEGRDLVVNGDMVYMKTIGAYARGRHLSPHRRRFPRPAGVPARLAAGHPRLMGAYRSGNVALANAVGNGIADDKAIYAWVPDIIRYYLGEDPILGIVPTWVCSREQDLKYVTEHLGELVVKAVGESGGYGMLMGPMATKAAQEDSRRRLIADPPDVIQNLRHYRRRISRFATGDAAIALRIVSVATNYAQLVDGVCP